MFSTIWHTLFFDPVYNGLVFFIDVVPGGDVGIAIILITVVVKTILLPLSIKAAKTQKVIKDIDPKIKEIKKDIKDPQEQARAIMDLYKVSGINPFASILLMLLQIPIIIALYLAVSNGGGAPLPDVNAELLYSFIPRPDEVSMFFLGMLDIAQKSLPLALLAGITQFIHGHLSFPKLPPRDPNAAPSMKDDFGRNMQLQMKYVMPVLIAIVAYTISAAIALYFVVSSVTAILQELVLKKHKN
jgi:YidC/Oxa1 family membrane protein insertase